MYNWQKEGISKNIARKRERERKRERDEERIREREQKTIRLPEETMPKVNLAMRTHTLVVTDLKSCD